MSNPIIKKAIELRQEIDNLPEIKEYYRLANLFENNKELQEIRHKIARLTKEKKLKERDFLLKEYNENPLVVNFEHAKEEAMKILKMVKETIEK